MFLLSALKVKSASDLIMAASIRGSSKGLDSIVQIRNLARSSFSKMRSSTSRSEEKQNFLGWSSALLYLIGRLYKYTNMVYLYSISIVFTMSAVVSFKVPADVKKRMERLKKYVNWNEELRSYLIRRLEELEREINIRRVVELLKKVGGVPSGTAAALIREDRDSG